MSTDATLAELQRRHMELQVQIAEHQLAGLRRATGPYGGQSTLERLQRRVAELKNEHCALQFQLNKARPGEAHIEHYKRVQGADNQATYWINGRFDQEAFDLRSKLLFTWREIHAAEDAVIREQYEIEMAAAKRLPFADDLVAVVFYKYRAIADKRAALAAASHAAMIHSSESLLGTPGCFSYVEPLTAKEGT